MRRWAYRATEECPTSQVTAVSWFRHPCRSCFNSSAPTASLSPPLFVRRALAAPSPAQLKTACIVWIAEAAETRSAGGGTGAGGGGWLRRESFERQRASAVGTDVISRAVCHMASWAHGETM